MAFKLFTCFLLFGAFVASSAAPAETVCESAECKALADDLLHRSMNTAVNPCDDFYSYVCGNWEKYHHMNEHSARLNAFTIRNEQVQHEVSSAIQSETRSTSHSVQYLASLYLECNNTETHNSRGLKPLHDILDSVLGGWPMTKSSHTAHGKHWNQVFTDLFAHTGVTPIFRIIVNYQRTLNANLLMIGPGGTGIAPQVLINPHLYQKQLTAYKNYVKTAAILMGAKDNEKLTEDIEKMIHLETNIAHVLFQHPQNFVRLGSLSGLNVLTNNRIDWVAWLNSILTATKSSTKHFTLSDKVGVANPEYLHGAAQVLDQSSEEVVQNLFAWLTVSVFGPLTTDKFRHEEAIFRAALTGVNTELPTPEYCYNIANSKLPFVVGRVYVDKNFSPADKKEAEALVKEVKSSFNKVLKNNDWLDEETQKLALEKLAAIRENIAYPDWLMADQDLDHFYSHLKNHNVEKGRFLESAIELNTLTVRHSFDTMHDPLNHTLLWPMTPVTINAAYMPTENSITIPAAILKSPFFDKSRPSSMNYGAIGAIIGHEMTHGFDNQGRQFDLHGERKNWWTRSTQTKFNEKAQCFVNQYGAVVEPLTHLHINGQLTLGENIADNGGVNEAFNAYQSHVSASGKAQVLPSVKLNSEQLFFVSYARNWCSVSRKEAMEQLIRTNPHPPDSSRVNVVLSNSKQFAQAFHCPAGAKMNPISKCAVW